MKIAVSLLGLDCPGVVHVVAATLARLAYNIEEISQTILKGQFAAIFIAQHDGEGSLDEVRAVLEEALREKNMDLSVIVRPFEEKDIYSVSGCEPFVITLDGEDRTSMVASFTRILADQKVNIENMKALMPEPDNPHLVNAPRHAVLIFEIALPPQVDRQAFRRTLEDRARSMGLRASMQHRDIFEALHRIEPM